MKKTSLKIDYEEEKLKAIDVSLRENGRELNSEVINFLDGLYKKNVPALLKKFVENDTKVQTKINENGSKNSQETSQ